MACAEEGYEDERFESDVPENLRCAICLNVLKQPMQCVRNEHSFCKPCILRHLQETQRCPTCIEPLTLETLRPSRVITGFLSQLKIKCDNYARGCPEVIKLEILEAHLANCEFSAVQCPNDGCEVIMNRRDQPHHQMNECDFRLAECRVCGERVSYWKRKNHCYVTRKEIDEMKRTFVTRKEIDKMKKSLKETKDEVSDIKELVTNLSRELRHHMVELERQVVEIKKENAFIKQKLESNECSGVSSVSAQTNIRKDIIVAGGWPAAAVSSVEVFNWPTRQWTLLPQMTSKRYGSFSFVYQQQMFVCGGMSSGNSMEVLKLTEENGRWKKFPGKLPQQTWGHSSVLYEHNLFIFGGEGHFKVFNDIYKMCLVPPYSRELVCHMPEPRSGHGAHCFGSKVFIVGGTTTGDYRGCLNSVLVFDIRTNCCQTISALPYHVCKMATVAWKDNIVMIGGQDRKGNVLNTVVVYNITNEKSEMLPPMIHKRAGCCAVITGNCIVVAGGLNKEKRASLGELRSVESLGELRSVECFNFDLYTWQELPPMNEPRDGATAVVKCV